MRWRQRFFQRKLTEKHLDAELRFHLEQRIADLVASGMAPEEACRQARLEFGGLDQVKEECRDIGGSHIVETLIQDLRYGLRQLRRNPGFTTVAVLTLALGIGANTAIFSLIDAFLLKALPVKDPQQLVLVDHVARQGRLENSFPYPVFEMLRDRSHSFSGMFAWDGSTMSVAIDGQPEFVSGDFVSGTYFDVLGVRAMLGRTFTADDDQPGKPTVAVISDAYWKRRFSQNPTVLGKSVYLGPTPFTIIGVMPPAFHGANVAGRSADVMLPMFVHPWLGLKDHDTFDVMARLKPGVSAAQAQTDLNLIYQRALTEAAGPRLSPQTEREVRAQRIELKPGSQGARQGDREHFAMEMRILMSVVGVALLIATINIANLLLGRSATRQKEIAVRLAIGASRARVFRQLLSESSLLGLIGGALGFLLAKLGVGALILVLSMGGDPFPFDLRPDPAILAFTASLALLTGILVGLIPAFAATRVDLNHVLKGATGGGESGRLRQRFGNLLVVSQITLSLALLIGAGLLIRTLQAVYTSDTGFERKRVLFAWVLPALNGYDHTREMRLYRDLLEKLNSTSEIRPATLSRYRQFVARPEKDIWVQGSDAASRGIYARTFTGRAVPGVYYNLVGPGFFRAMGITQLLGRDFAASDTENSSRVAIISASMARTFFPDQNPIGKRLGFNGPDSSGDYQIVGVVSDTRHHLLENSSLAAVYLPYTQGAPDDYGQMNLVVESKASQADVAATMQRQVRVVDRSLPLADIETPAADLDEYLGDHRSLATLLSCFGGLALALASIGLYGVMSYAVGRRTKELSIRMALGARPGILLRMVLRETLALATLGVLIGILLAAASERLLKSMLFGVQSTDPVTIIAAVLVMFATAALAGYIPARRAAKVDPMVALRYE